LWGGKRLQGRATIRENRKRGRQGAGNKKSGPCKRTRNRRLKREKRTTSTTNATFLRQWEDIKPGKAPKQKAFAGPGVMHGPESVTMQNASGTEKNYWGAGWLRVEGKKKIQSVRVEKTRQRRGIQGGSRTTRPANRGSPVSEKITFHLRKKKRGREMRTDSSIKRSQNTKPDEARGGGAEVPRLGPSSCAFGLKKKKGTRFF